MFLLVSFVLFSFDATGFLVFTAGYVLRILKTRKIMFRVIMSPSVFSYVSLSFVFHFLRDTGVVL